MNCRSFEHHVADWLGGRLTWEQAQAMTGHVRSCRECARSAHHETVLRDVWQEASGLETSLDLWPRLDSRLAALPERRLSTPFARQWAWGAALLTLLGMTWGVFHWTPVVPLERSNSPNIVQPEGVETPPVPASVLAQSALADVPQVNPDVDDPARSSVEQIWMQLKTNANTESQSQ